MPAILNRLSVFFMNYILRDLDDTKILLYKLSVRYLVVKLAVALLDSPISRSLIFLWHSYFTCIRSSPIFAV